MVLFGKIKSKAKRWIIFGLLFLSVCILMVVSFFYAYLAGWVGLPTLYGIIYNQTFIEDGKKHRYMIHVPYGDSKKDKALITIAHPKKSIIISSNFPVMKGILYELSNYETFFKHSKLSLSQKPVLVHYFYYWEDAKKKNSWLRGSNKDPEVAKHVFDASNNFQVFIQDFKKKNPEISKIFGYGYSFEGEALLALSQEHPEIFSGLAALASPTVSACLPQLKDNLPKIAHIPLYFAWGEKDRILGGDKYMVEREKPFRDEVEQIVKHYVYKIVPNANHHNFPYEEEKKAIDWIFNAAKDSKPAVEK